MFFKLATGEKITPKGHNKKEASKFKRKNTYSG